MILGFYLHLSIPYQMSFELMGKKVKNVKKYKNLEKRYLKRTVVRKYKESYNIEIYHKSYYGERQYHFMFVFIITCKLPKVIKKKKKNYLHVLYTILSSQGSDLHK